METRYRFTPQIAVEILILFAAAPILYFPDWVPSWFPFIAIAILAVTWVWRRIWFGKWYEQTPADWPIFFLFLVLLPMSIWVAPTPLRLEFSIPKAYILYWNFFFFWMIVTYASQSITFIEWAIGGLILSAVLLALIAPFGINWLDKFYGFQTIVDQIPQPLMGVFAGAEEGFHPNQVAGTVLYGLPLMLAISYSAIVHRNRMLDSRVLTWLVVTATLLVGLVVLVTQSRSALIGLIVSIMVMTLINWRWGRWMLLLGVGVAVTGSLYAPANIVDIIGGTPPGQRFGGVATLGFRQDVWTQSLAALHDYWLTGIGLGTFREVIFLLYPTNVLPTYNLGHAHNFFLQTALDFGILGLISILAIYILTLTQIIVMWRRKVQDSQSASIHIYAIGFLGCVVAQTVFSMLDAVAMGSKTNIMFWFLLALIFSMANFTTIHESNRWTSVSPVASASG